jgi:excisionase family DNA binding protein
VIDLATLLQDPDQAAKVRPEQVPALLGELERVKAVLWARLLSLPAGNDQPEAPAPGRPAKTTVPTDLPDPDSRAGLKPVPTAYPRVARSSLLSVKEVARQLSCSEAAVRKWIYQRRLPTVKVGRLTRLRLADLEALVAKGLRRARPIATKPNATA